ncbi:hypothetical protein HS7_14650 [Sulfolobales archaeon HS-7]|nr:hypothetical protein HS7_14650 [Sulfolobales archaeon HS-7]
MDYMKGILIIVLTVLISSVVLFVVPHSIGESYTLYQKISPHNVKEVIVRGYNGEINVLQWNKSYILLQQCVRSLIVKPTTELKVVQNNTAVEIELLNQLTSFLIRRVNLTIYLPRDLYLNLSISLTNMVGRIEISSFDAISVSAANGVIYANVSSGKYLSLSSSNGEIYITPENVSVARVITSNGEIYFNDVLPITSGEYYISSSNGQITVHINRQSSISIKASTVLGSINVNGITFNNVTYSQGYFSGILGKGKASMSISVQNGEVLIS